MRFPDTMTMSGASSVHRKIFGATVTVTLMTGVGSLAFCIKELLTAAWFGTSDPLEAFVIAILVPALFTELVRASIGAAIVPTILRARALHGEEFAQGLLSRVMTLTFLVLIALSLLLMLASPVLLRFIAGSFAPAKLALTQSLFYVFVPLVVVTGLSASWAAVLNMRGSFALPSLTSALVPICAAAALVVWGDVGGVWALAAGTLAGGVCEFLVLGVAVRKRGARVLPCRISMDTFAWQFLRQWSVLAIAAFLSLAIMTIDQSMASMLGPGNVGALNYGFKVVATLWTLGPMALGTVVLPYLSRYTAEEDYEKLLAILKTNALIGLAAAIPLTIVLVSWTEEITRVFFQRGAFSAQDTVVVGGVQAMYAIGLPFITIHVVGSRLLSAILMNRVLVFASAVALILKVFLNYLLMAHMGVKGIALATSLVYVLQTGIVLGAIWWADLRGKRAPAGLGPDGRDKSGVG